MPSLQIFHRRTFFAGDDLQPTAIINAFFRSFQFVVLVCPVLIHLIYETRHFLEAAKIWSEQTDDQRNQDVNVASYLFGGMVYPQECDGQFAHYFPLLLYMYLVLTTCHTFLSNAVEYIIYKISSIGTPTQPHLRSSLAKVLEKKWIWLSIVGNFFVASFGVVCLSYNRYYFDCRAALTQDLDGELNDEAIVDSGDWITKVFGRAMWWIAFSLLLVSQIVEGLVATFALVSLLQKEKTLVFISQNYYDIDAPRNTSFEDVTLDFDHSPQSPRYNMHHPHQLAEEMWDNRCRNFCKCAAFSTCYLFGGRELVDGVVGDYGQISRGE